MNECILIVHFLLFYRSKLVNTRSDSIFLTIQQIKSGESLARSPSSSDISEEVYDYIFNICSDKNIAVISDNIPLKYMQYQTIFNHSNIEYYLFFVASAGRAPMLVNKNRVIVK